MAVAAVLVALWLLPSGLTVTGARARGQAQPAALVAGLAWPLTWAVWYVRDADADVTSGTATGTDAPRGA